MTPEEKMIAWHEGTRKLNIKACSDDKLVNYYNICCELGYIMKANILYTEMCNRLIDWTDPISENIADNIVDFDKSKYCEYIEGHACTNGDFGTDLFKNVRNNGKLILYSWSAEPDGHISIFDADCVLDFENNTMHMGDEEGDMDDVILFLEEVDNFLFSC